MAGWTGSRGCRIPPRRSSISIDLGCNFSTTAWAYGDGQAKTSWQKRFAPIPQKTLRRHKNSRRKTAAGPALKNFRRRLLSACLRFRIRGQKPEKPRLESLDLIQYHRGWIRGSMTRARRTRSKVRSSGKVRAVASARIAGTRKRHSRCARWLVDAVQSSTTSSTKIPRTNFPCLPRKDVASSRAFLLTKVRSPARSRSIPRGPKAIGRNTFLFLKI